MRFAWLTLLFLAVSVLNGQDRFSGVDKIVAVGDVHGDLGQFATVLRDAGLIDKKNKWIGKKSHLVQVGDIPDRGPDTRRIYDLLMELEKQAKKAGGMVHCLIGNHDAMNVYGDLRYVIPEEFAAFKTGDSSGVRDAVFEQELPNLKKMAEAKGLKPSDSELKQQFEEEHPLGWVEHRFNYGPNGKYGKWIRGRQVSVIVNGFMFLHGGISQKYAERTPAELTSAVQAELNDFTKIEGGVAIDPLGPLWYRGLARDPEETLMPHVDGVLKFHNIEAIAIGHTPTAGAVLPRFGGKVLLIDVGMSKYYGGPPACLIVEGGKRYALHRGKRLDLPSKAEDVLAYLRQAAALDPAPSPLEKLISGAAVEATKDVP